MVRGRRVSAMSAPLLIAEDDPNDMFLFTRLLKSAGVTNPIHVALNGAEAIELLGRVIGRGQMLQTPAAAFLDTRMPKCDGLEVLAWIRARPALDRLAVVMLSHSDDAPAVAAAEALGAQYYLRKYPSGATVARVIAEARRFNVGPEMRFLDMPNNLLRARSPEASS